MSDALSQIRAEVAADMLRINGRRSAMRTQAMKRLYGDTWEEWYSQRLILQEFRCSICGRKKKLVTDHDHESGELRGLLCHSCNFILGYLNDDPAMFRRAIEYLRTGGASIR